MQDKENLSIFIIEKKLEDFEINNTKKEELINFINNNKEAGTYFINTLTEYPELCKFKNINIEDIDFSSGNSLQKIESINKSLFNMTNPAKKEDNDIIKLLKKNNLKTDLYLRLIEKKKLNKNLIKSHKMDFSEETKKIKDIFDNFNNGSWSDIKYNFELQNDKIEKEIIVSNANKLERSIISNKYKKLINNETKNIFIECAMQGIKKEDLIQNVAPKIAAMETPEQFNELLENSIGLNIDWSLEGFKKKAKDMNVEIVREDNNQLYLEINNFQDSQQFGSRMWCITREEEYLNDYLYRENSRIVFKFDFDKDIKSPDAYTALLYQGKRLSDIYDKNDKNLSIHLFADSEPDAIDYKKIILKEESQDSLDRKRAKMKELLRTQFRSDYHENPIVLNLMNLKLFDEVNSMSEGNLSIYSGYTNRLMFSGYLQCFDKEQVKFLESYKHRHDLISDKNTSTQILALEKIKRFKDKESVDEFFNNSFVKKNIKNLEGRDTVVGQLFEDDFIMHLEEYGLKKLQELIKPYGFDISSVFSKMTRENINDEKLALFEKLEPNFIYNAAEAKPKSVVISFAKDNDLSKDNIKKFIKQVSKQETVKTWLDKYVRVLSKRTTKDRFVEIYDEVNNPKSKNKIKRAR